MTDYEFLMESANKYGKTVYAHGNKVYVQDEVTISNEDVVLEWGKSLVSFRGRESLKGQLSGCSFVGWDSRKGQGITGRVSLGEVPVKVGGGRSWEDNSKAAGGRWHSTIMEESLRDREEAVVLAKAYLQNLSMQYQMAECKCEGDQRILPGMRVTVKYVGESYSGEYIANHVLHEFSVYGGYTTTLYLKRNMAGGEKKRVSPIDSEMMRERLRRMEERMHGPVDQESAAVDEAEVEPALAAETAPPAESQETGEEVVFLRGSNEQFVQNMRNLIGTPYVWGGDDPTINGGVDCSGSILYALNQMGNGLLDQRAWQIYSNLTLPVDDGDIQAGYLRFLRNANGEINHVQVIVAEDGSRVNASGTDANTRDNPGIIELLSGPLPQNGEIRRLQFRE